MLAQRFAFLIFLILLDCTEAQQGVIVNTTEGQIRGQTYMVQTIGVAADRIISTFKGVPYAKPPVENLRFQSPLPHDKWEGVRNATSYGNGCGQFFTGEFYVEEAFGYKAGPYGNDDCLFLNIFAPGDVANMKESLSVMVWIHGGAFLQGFSDGYDLTQLALHGNVIMVNLNYRLGALGFLAFDDAASASYNNGLRDQIMALKWIKNNIANFGGNPKEVTIFGESAGSVSVSLLLVSPLSKGLFKRAIAQSGALNILPIHNKCHSEEQYSYASKSLIPRSNCTSANVSETVACLKNVKLETIVKYQLDGNILASLLNNMFTPCYGDDVVPRKPLEIFKSGQIHVDDVIIGGNNDDGSFMFNPFVQVTKETFQKSLERLIKTFYPKEWGRVYAAALHEYSPYDPTMYSRQLLNVYTDRLIADYQVLADEISFHNVSVYHYIFNYSQKYFPLHPDWLQGAHADELLLEFLNVLDPNLQLLLPNVTLAPEDMEVAKTLATAFTSFAKTGDPNNASLPFTWPQYDVTNRQSLEIIPNMTSDNVKSNPRRKAMDFWNNLIPLLAEPEICPATTTELPTSTPAAGDCSLTGCISDVIVNITSGQLRGYVFSAQTDGITELRRITKFLGIPYAKPPIGDLRFAPPVENNPWNEVRNATAFGNMCPQFISSLLGFGLSGPYGDEDCLTLNVYIPGKAHNGTERFPVMVWIHGGGLIIGSANTYDPTQLALHGNVIVVTINYRLGIFGRINTNGSYANIFLKDQILALKWVKENIASFGGDPKQVTIFGQSSGGVSVNYLLVSPQSTGLFKRAISQSPAFGIVIQSPEQCAIKQYLIGLAQRVNCTKEQMVDFKCLQTVSKDTILYYQFNDNGEDLFIDITKYNISMPLCYGDDVLLHNPIDMFGAGKMHNTTESVIIGGNNDEGAFAFNTSAPIDKSTFEMLLSALLKASLIPNQETILPIVLHEYAPSENREQYNRQALNGISDNLHAEFQNVADAINNYDYKPKVYHYIYNYRRSLNLLYENWVQAGHAEEILPEFGNVLDPNFAMSLFPTESEKEVSRIIMTLFTNFAKTGDPNPLYGAYAGITWPLYEASTRYSLEITGNIIAESVKSHPRRKGVEFWNMIIPSIIRHKQCPATDMSTVAANPTPLNKLCQVLIGPLSLNAEAANRLLWGLGLSLGFVIIFAVILIAALIKCYRDKKSLGTLKKTTVSHLSTKTSSL